MGARSDARKRAVEVLYEADLRGLEPDALLSDRVGSARVPVVDDYTVTLVSGIATHRPRIDELVVDHSEGWTLARMPVVDRAVLRLAFFEMLWGTDVPPAVVIDEAVRLAKSLSTDDSPRFVNGVLGRMAGIDEQARESLRAEEPDTAETADEEIAETADEEIESPAEAEEQAGTAGLHNGAAESGEPDDDGGRHTGEDREGQAADV